MEFASAEDSEETSSGEGITPICRIIPRSSLRYQSSAILPPEKRLMVMPVYPCRVGVLLV